MISILDEADKNKLEIDQLTLGILPYGSGNDLAKILGWGSSPQNVWSAKLGYLAELIINANEETFNIWNIQAFCRPNGNIY